MATFYRAPAVVVIREENKQIGFSVLFFFSFPLVLICLQRKKHSCLLISKSTEGKESGKVLSCENGSGNQAEMLRRDFQATLRAQRILRDECAGSLLIFLSSTAGKSRSKNQTKRDRAENWQVKAAAGQRNAG